MRESGGRVTKRDLKTGTTPNLSRRRFLKGAGGIGLGLLVNIACRDSSDSALTTLDGTIGLGEDDALVTGPGEPYEVRSDLAEAQASRDGRRRSLLVFHHLSDFRIVDEESPLRSEWVESCEPPLSTSAFRPHEALSVHTGAAIISRANQIDRSPVSGRPVDFAIHTGSAVDNAQHNELRWFLDLMDGNPVQPDSGAPGYEGVQMESPLAAYGDLLDEAQLAFLPQGLRYPWYAVAGSRDLLAQGNFPPSDQAQAIATGDQKVIALGPLARAEVCADPSALLGPGSSDKVLNDPETVLRTVTPDKGRGLLTRKEWVDEHFNTAPTPGPVGHGFSEENRQAGTAYYVLDQGSISFIILDSVNPGGFSAGSIDATQFLWLEEQLKARSTHFLDANRDLVVAPGPDRLIVIVSHHPSAAMNNPFPDSQSTEERFRGPQLEQMLHRFPNVILHISGHTLEHRIAARPDLVGNGSGYWEITTGSPLDYPMQGRLLEMVENADGTISIFSTVYDSAAPLVPGDADDPTPDDGVNQLLLAAVARRAAALDSQLNPEAAGLAPSDRNAELLLPAPFNLESLATPQLRSLSRAPLRVARRSFLPLPR